MPQSPPGDLELYRDAIADGAWVLCETKSRVSRLRASLGAPHAIWTVADATRLFLERSARARLLEDAVDHDVSDVVRETVLARLLRERADREASTAVDPQVLCRFFDRVRLSMLTEVVLADAMTEFGETLVERDDLARAIELLDRYREEQQALGTFDRIGLLERALEVLSSIPAEQAKLPPLIVLDQPSSFSPLEQELWQAISRLSRIVVAIPSYLEPMLPPVAAPSGESSRERRLRTAPSLRHWLPVQEWIASFGASERLSVRSLGSVAAGREAMVPILFDGVVSETVSILPEELPDIVECETRSQEVRALAEAIRTAAGLGAAYGDWHVVVPDLGRYAALLRALFQEYDIPLSIPRGQRTVELPAGSFAVAALEALLRPAVSSLRQLIAHPWARCAVAPADVAARLQLPLELVEQLGMLPAEEAPPQHAQLAVQVERILDLFELLGLDDDLASPETWLPLVLRVLRDSKARPAERGTTGVPGLLWILERVADASELAPVSETPVLLARELRRYSRRLRQRLSQLFRSGEPDSGQPGQSDRAAAVQALRRVQRIVGITARTIRTWDETLTIRERFREFERVARDLMSASWVPEDFRPEAVLVTEPLDLRGEWGRRVALLGVSAEDFPGGGKGLSTPLDPLEVATSRLSDFGDPKHRIDESYALLAHTVRAASTLTFSFVDQAEQGEAQPAEFLRILSLYRTPALASVTPTEAPERAVSAPLRERRLQLLHGRAAPEFGATDGELGGALPPESLAAPLRRPEDSATHGLDPELPWCSISSLEKLAECPHKFFFSTVLQLRSRTVPRQERAMIVGSFLHRVLERFFTEPRNRALSLLDDEAVWRVLGAVLSEELELSPYPWRESSPWIGEWIRLRAGVSNRNREGTVVGPLAAAIHIQRNVLRTTVLHVESRFGTKRVPPLVIEGPFGGMALTGTIDRIDLVEGPSGPAIAVWDYKTGASLQAGEARSETLCGRLLQVPLYADAMSRVLGDERPVAAGGLLFLSKWRDTPAAQDPIGSQGVVAELLAIQPTGGGRYRRDPAAVPERINAARAQVQKLAGLLTHGSLHQVLETPPEVCERCEFRGVCARNEARLLAKSGVSASQTVRWDLPPSPRRRKVVFELRPSHGLSKEQGEACAPDRHIALSAGAGSGKTSVLTTRCVELLLRGEPLESLAAITFTEKAAAELRSRIALRIEQLLRGDTIDGRTLNDVERQRLLNARVYLPLAQIGTIHAFAKMVIATDPVSADLGTQPEVITRGDQRQMMVAAISRTLRRPSLRADVESLFEMGLTIDRLTGHLRQLYEQRLFLRELLESAECPDSGPALRTLLAAKTEERLTPFFLSVEQELAAWLADVERYLTPDKKKRTADDVAAIANFRAVVATGLEQWRRASVREERAQVIQQIEAAYTSEPSFEGRKEFQSFVKRAVTPFRKAKDKPNFLQPRKEVLWLMHAPGELEQRAHDVMSQVTRILAAVHEDYTQQKREARVVDFDDLMIGALRVVESKDDRGDPAPSVVRLQRRIRHILVDEFQDTDRDQWTVVRTVMLDAPPASREESPRTVFVVGDVQQAIYGFRGGDPEVWQSSVDSLLARGGSALSLRENYRSDPALVHFFNVLFPPLLRRDLPALRERFQTLAARRAPAVAGGERVTF